MSGTRKPTPDNGFPEERLVRPFLIGIQQAQSEDEVRRVIEGALKVGYRRGVQDCKPPLQPEDLESFAEGFADLAAVMRSVRDLRERQERRRCVNDTNGDGDCAACAKDPNAPCRVDPDEEARSNAFLESLAEDALQRRRAPDVD